jgi:tetratricopeptide (TPR) repeat protein
MRTRALALLLAASLAAATAAAEQAGDVAAAREHYARGEALFDRGDYISALGEFRQAYRASPHPVALKSQAECQLRIGDARAAVDLYEQYLREQPDAADRREVEDRIRQLRSRPGRLDVTSSPAGARVVVDGNPAPGTTPLSVDLAPGVHLVGLELDGHEVVWRRIGVEYASETALDETLVPLAAEAPRPGRVDEPRGARLRLTTPFWVMVGLGSAALVAGAISGSVSLAHQSEFREAVDGGRDRDELEQLSEQGRLEALVADVAFGVAAAAGIAAIVLLLVESFGHQTANDPVVAPLTGGSGASLTARF